ncbi:MAG: TonB family protein, partial [Pyrinomonadaceae bacterium]
QTERETGIELYKKGDYSGASRILKKASKSHAADGSVWYYLGLSYLKQDNKKEALKALEKAVALDGKNADFHAGLAYLYLLRDEPFKAQKEAQASLDILPNNAEAHYIIGVVNYKNESFSGAYERAKKAIELNPGFAPAYLLKSESLVNSFAIQLGTILKPQDTRKDFLNEAVADLEKYLSLSPANKKTEFYLEYLQSLKFFTEYYSRTENQKPVNFDADTQIDTVKTPIKILSRPQPQYTDSARQNNVSGTVRLLVGFSADGTVKHVLVLKPLDYGLSEVAVRAARRITFEPPTKDGKPYSVVKQVTYTFTIY